MFYDQIFIKEKEEVDSDVTKIIQIKLFIHYSHLKIFGFVHGTYETRFLKTLIYVKHTRCPTVS